MADVRINWQNKSEVEDQGQWGKYVKIVLTDMFAKYVASRKIKSMMTPTSRCTFSLIQHSSENAYLSK